ncbi:MAG: hypothetical protein JXA77_06425 [Bacteroidales bacterium]|nr:hypothetical protein [Bacteroidales bacterium]MBN2819471.1 hypothetical protein [Bacteroidales bacterium]
MKRLTFSLFFVLAIGILSLAQNESPEVFKPSGKVTGKIFLNYHLNITPDANQLSAFEMNRAYFGYQYSFSKNISAKILLDGTKKSDASDYTMFVKNALVDWKVGDQFKFSGGIIGQTQFNTQEKLFGYRYVFKSMQDYYKMESTADLGINAEIKPMDGFVANVFLLNGEGYTDVQDNLGRMKVGANIAFNPVDELVLKGYYDMYGGKVESNLGEVVTDTASIHTIGLFAGYKADVFRVGVDFTTQMNAKKYNTIASDLNRSGLAINGAYTLNDNIELFGEYLMLTSNTLEGATDPWNLNGDGSTIILGCQYSPVKGVKGALNYQGYYPAIDGADPTHMVYLNLELSF